MKVNIGALKNELSRYLNEVKAGNEVTITDHNKPIAKIMPLQKQLVAADTSQWFRKNPPVAPKKKQPNSGELIRAIRDEE